MIQNLSVDERKMFLKELKKTVATKDRFCKPSGADLRQLAYHNSLPFVGFGFLDNFIMIIAGEYIDLTLGGWLLTFNQKASYCALHSSLYKLLLLENLERSKYDWFSS